MLGLKPTLRNYASRIDRAADARNHRRDATAARDRLGAATRSNHDPPTHRAPGSAQRPFGPASDQNAQLHFSPARRAPHSDTRSINRAELRIPSPNRFPFGLRPPASGPWSLRDPPQTAGRHHQARRPAVLRLAAVAGNADGRFIARFSVQAVSLSVRGRGVSLSARRRGAGRRNGAGQNDAGDHGDALAASLGEMRSVLLGLPQAAGDQLAARVCPVGAGVAGRGDRRGSSQAALAMAAGRRADQNRQLRGAAPRSANGRRSEPALRSGRARRIAADQESRQHDEPGRALDLAHAQLGADRHAGRKQPGGPGRHFRVPRPGASFCRHEAAARWAGRPATMCCGAPRTRCSPSCRPRCFATPTSNYCPSSARPISWPKTRACCG